MIASAPNPNQIVVKTSHGWQVVNARTTVPELVEDGHGCCVDAMGVCGDCPGEPSKLKPIDSGESIFHLICDECEAWFWSK